jgi:hypothetical protein
MPNRDQILVETIGVFEPIIDLLVAIGVTAKDAQRALQHVWVKRVVEAEEKRLPPGSKRRVSDARVSLMTGVPRNTVGDIRRRQGLQLQTTHRALRVLQAWHSHPRYSKDGVPIALRLGADAVRGISFWSLVREVSNASWPGTVMNELLARGAVEKRDGLYHAKRDGFVGAEPELEKLRRLADICNDLVATLAYNSTAAPSRRLAVQTFENKYVPVAVARRVRRQLREIAAGLNDSTQLALDFKPPEGSENGQYVRMGLTVFAFEQALDGQALRESQPLSRARSEH